MIRIVVIIMTFTSYYRGNKFRSCKKRIVYFTTNQFLLYFFLWIILKRSTSYFVYVTAVCICV